MKSIFEFYKKNTVFTIVTIVYTTLTIISLNYCYFWDNIYYTPDFAIKFYNFDADNLVSLNTILNNQFIASLGLHPPTLGFITAVMWKFIGPYLWVSHLFFYIWFLVISFNLWKLLQITTPKEIVSWIFILIMLEPAMLSQYVIASPDFILITAFILSTRAIFENNKKLLLIGLIILCGIHIRGLFAGVILLFVDYYYQLFIQKKQLNIGLFIKITYPYLIVFSIFLAYIIIYYNAGGISILESPNKSHYSTPNFNQIIKNIATFSLRSIESGRIIIWISGFVILFLMLKNKIKTSNQVKVILILFILHFGLYFIFIFISRMPFCHRYFFPHYIALTIIVINGIWNYFNQKKAIILFVTILFFEITGNFWIYPNPISNSWDCTLAHLPYYELRKKCFNFIDSSKIDYNRISADYTLYGNRKMIELSKDNKIVKNQTESSKEEYDYFIYSNISNSNDSLLLNLKDSNYWVPIKKFEKGFVDIIIYKRTSQSIKD
jgi:hypothetical protein